MTVARAAAAVVLAVVLGWMGWLVVQTTRADQLGKTDPAATLRLDPDHPKALLWRAWKQLAAGDDEAATATARHVLAVAPGEGDAFAVIALAAARRGDPDAARLLDIALKRAPRVHQVRAQVATMRLKAGDIPGALVQLDALLRLEPALGAQFFPAMAQQADTPEFADALAATLARNPRWRGGFLAALNAKGTAAAMDRVYGRLRAEGGLSDVETARWLDRALAQGRWGDAFASWIGTLDPPPDRIPPVRNGGFEGDIGGVGFEWRNQAASGVFTDIAAGAGPDGSRAAHLHFIGRPAALGNLRQPLFLAPGRYRLSLQVRGDFLHSDQGLQWVVRCDKGPQVAATEGFDGSFDWKRISVDFKIPAGQCPGQWLELRNPAVTGSAQQTSGDLWVDDVAITPLKADSVAVTTP